MDGPAVVKVPGAVRDLRAIYVQIALDGGRTRARGVLAALDETIVRLARRPLLGRVRAELPGQPHGFRFRRWTISYRPLPDGSGVIILRIIDNRRDISALFGKKT